MFSFFLPGNIATFVARGYSVSWVDIIARAWRFFLNRNYFRGLADDIHRPDLCGLTLCRAIYAGPHFTRGGPMPKDCWVNGGATKIVPAYTAHAIPKLIAM